MYLFQKTLILLIVFMSSHNLSANASGKEDNDSKLLIGVVESPPFVIMENDRLSGLSIRSWEMVNQRLGAEYEFMPFPSLSALLEAVENRRVDFSINPITVTERRMEMMDFSQPYFISETGVLKRLDTSPWQYLWNIFTWDFLVAVMALVGIIFLFGFLVWIFERKRNIEEFGGGINGVFQGFWWSAVTMTTVGYGDKSPKSLGGRIVAFIWMFSAIVMISSLTAGIASTLTVHNIRDEIATIDDLRRFSVGTVEQSSAQDLLDLYNIPFGSVSNVPNGVQQVLDGQKDAFVYDKPLLIYELNRREAADKLHVLPGTLKKDYYSYTFPKNSPLLETIDPILISVLKTMEWNVLMQEYQ